MRATNQKRTFGMWAKLAAMMALTPITSPVDQSGYRGPVQYFGDPIFTPRYHTKQSYRSQQRDAKKKRRAR